MSTLIQGPIASYLLAQAGRIRAARTVEELDFILLNETRNFLAYRNAAIWRRHLSAIALSGMAIPDPNAPYVQWLGRVGTTLARYGPGAPVVVEQEQLAPADAADWVEWLPDHLVWRGLGVANDDTASTDEPEAAWGVLFAREEPWTEDDLVVISELTSQWMSARLSLMATKAPGIKDYWVKLLDLLPDGHDFKRYRRRTFATWRLMRQSLRTPEKRRSTGQHLVARVRHHATALRDHFKESTARLAAARAEQGWRGWFKSLSHEPGRFWKNHPRGRWVALSLLLLFPVRLSVLAPGELVPQDPLVVRSPADGIIDQYFVQPNTMVEPGQLLVQLDLTSLIGRQKVSEEELAIAEAEYRQSNLQSLSDPKARTQLLPLEAKVGEKRAEADLASSLLKRARITAPEAGMVLFDEPSELVGKPVSAGERLVVIANPDDVEIEAWLPVNDAIALAPDDETTLYLNARPFSPVRGMIRYVGYEPIRRPDATYAYRIRATVDAASGVRIGLKGTTRFYGEYVPLVYWILRKPIAWVRYTLAI